MTTKIEQLSKAEPKKNDPNLADSSKLAHAMKVSGEIWADALECQKNQN